MSEQIDQKESCIRSLNMFLLYLPSHLFKANAIDVVVARHVRKNDRVAFIQSFKYLNLVNRSASNLHLNAYSALVIGRSP